ncbi:hypothetical protein HYS84_01750 [Candidatus Saccharibacteria bacterium]|nr:hypothetical protein [Candidatus Saccharibacteria bacterium]
MPVLDPDKTEIEIVDAEGNVVVVEIPSAALQVINMPQLPEGMPREAHKLIEKGLGLGRLACHITNRNDKAGLVKVDLPTSPKPTTLTASISRLPREV